MWKRTSLLFILIALLLGACAGQETPASPTEALASIAPTPTKATKPTQPEQSEAAASDCTVVSQRPTPGPTEESLFPSVSEKDWVQGPESAYVTLTEYSDFQ